MRDQPSPHATYLLGMFFHLRQEKKSKSIKCHLLVNLRPPIRRIKSLIEKCSLSSKDSWAQRKAVNNLINHGALAAAAQ